MGEAKRRGTFEERQAAAVQARIDFVRQRRLTREAQELAWRQMKAQAESEAAAEEAGKPVGDFEQATLRARRNHLIIETLFSNAAERIIKGI